MAGFEIFKQTLRFHLLDFSCKLCKCNIAVVSKLRRMVHKKLSLCLMLLPDNKTGQYIPAASWGLFCWWCSYMHTDKRPESLWQLSQQQQYQVSLPSRQHQTKPHLLEECLLVLWGSCVLLKTQTWIKPMYQGWQRRAEKSSSYLINFNLKDVQWI